MRSNISTRSLTHKERRSTGRRFASRTTGHLLGFPATLFLSTVLWALRGLMSGVEKWSVPGLRATSQNILWSTSKLNDKSWRVWHANLDKKIIQFLSVELTCATLGSDQNLTLFIKRRESQGHTQLSMFAVSTEENLGREDSTCSDQ